MRRWLTAFVQVAFGLLASHLLLAQHIGMGGSAAPAHVSGQGHVGLSSRIPSRIPSLPSGPMALRPGVRYPSSPILEGQHRPSTSAGPPHRHDDGRRGVDYRNHTPYIYTGYTWLNPLGYGVPVAYGGLPYAGQDDAGDNPQPVRLC